MTNEQTTTLLTDEQRAEIINNLDSAQLEELAAHLMSMSKEQADPNSLSHSELLFLGWFRDLNNDQQHVILDLAESGKLQAMPFDAVKERVDNPPTHAQRAYEKAVEQADAARAVQPKAPAKNEWHEFIPVSEQCALAIMSMLAIRYGIPKGSLYGYNSPTTLYDMVRDIGATIEETIEYVAGRTLEELMEE